MTALEKNEPDAPLAERMVAALAEMGYALSYARRFFRDGAETTIDRLQAEYNDRGWVLSVGVLVGQPDRRVVNFLDNKVQPFLVFQKRVEPEPRPLWRRAFDLATGATPTAKWEDTARIGAAEFVGLGPDGHREAAEKLGRAAEPLRAFMEKLHDGFRPNGCLFIFDEQDSDIQNGEWLFSGLMNRERGKPLSDRLILSLRVSKDPANSPVTITFSDWLRRTMLDPDVVAETTVSGFLAKEYSSSMNLRPDRGHRIAGFHFEP